MSEAYDYAVVGGGIVGLATALALTERHPRAKLLLVEKEKDWARHQTGHNSGVLHSGIYYKPGSLKARLARKGNQEMVRFCRDHDIAHDVCGKVIVATDASELPRMEALYRRGLENGLAVEQLSTEAVKEREPHVRSLGGILVPTAGIVDFVLVCRVLASLLEERGADLRLGCQVTRQVADGATSVLETPQGAMRARLVVACAGLQSDRLARAAGLDPEARIVPFRGEYYELAPHARSLVRHLIYPVPDPAFPFLGVHLTRMIDGNIHAGPNAVLSFKREGYHKWAFSAADLWDAVTYGGFWRMAARHWRMGWEEMMRSWSKAAFVRSLQRLVPEIRSADLEPSVPGVRAQALRPDGALVDDFLLVSGPRTVHVCNAPSPAATAALAIGEEIVAQLPED